MKQSFRSGLESYNEVAKDESDLEKISKGEKESDKTVGDVQKEMQELVAVLDWQLSKRAEKSLTSKDVQLEIYEVQKQKQAIMQELKETLAHLDSSDGFKQEKGKIPREITQKDGQLLWKGIKPITLGEIITDGAWGIQYHLDPVTVPRAMRKRFFVEEAKRKIEELLDQQIFAEEIAKQTRDWKLQDAYKRSKEDRDTGAGHFGLLVEKMIIQFLRKAVIDRDMPFSVQSADVYQDITQKVDFLIRRKISFWVSAGTYRISIFTVTLSGI